MPELVKTDAPLPAGFREDVGGGSGLIVPEAISRKRTVVTEDEWKAITTTTKKFCQPHDVRVVFVCNQCASPEEPFMKRIRTANGFILRCPHRDLVFSPEPPKKGPRR